MALGRTLESELHSSLKYIPALVIVPVQLFNKAGMEDIDFYQLLNYYDSTPHEPDANSRFASGSHSDIKPGPCLSTTLIPKVMWWCWHVCGAQPGGRRRGMSCCCNATILATKGAAYQEVSVVFLSASLPPPDLQLFPISHFPTWNKLQPSFVQ